MNQPFQEGMILVEGMLKRPQNFYPPGRVGNITDVKSDDKKDLNAARPVVVIPYSHFFDYLMNFTYDLMFSSEALLLRR